jgi:hypothetical protein
MKNRWEAASEEFERLRAQARRTGHPVWAASQRPEFTLDGFRRMNEDVRFSNIHVAERALLFTMAWSNNSGKEDPVLVMTRAICLAAEIYTADMRGKVQDILRECVWAVHFVDYKDRFEVILKRSSGGAYIHTTAEHVFNALMFGCHRGLDASFDLSDPRDELELRAWWDVVYSIWMRPYDMEARPYLRGVYDSPVKEKKLLKGRATEKSTALAKPSEVNYGKHLAYMREMICRALHVPLEYLMPSGHFIPIEYAEADARAMHELGRAEFMQQPAPRPENLCTICGTEYKIGPTGKVTGCLHVSADMAGDKDFSAGMLVNRESGRVLSSWTEKEGTVKINCPDGVTLIDSNGVVIGTLKSVELVKDPDYKDNVYQLGPPFGPAKYLPGACIDGNKGPDGWGWQSVTVEPAIGDEVWVLVGVVEDWWIAKGKVVGWAAHRWAAQDSGNQASSMSWKVEVNGKVHEVSPGRIFRTEEEARANKNLT